MPLSHVGLTVSHLSSAQTFYQAVLQPLGYRCLCRSSSQAAFGTTAEPDFFLCQDPSRGRPSGTHVALTAGSSAQVDAFYTAALVAGGQTHVAPGRCGSEQAEYSASIIDIDNNAVEVACGIPVGSIMSHHDASTNGNSLAGTLQRLPLQTIVNNLSATMSAAWPGDEPKQQQLGGTGSKALVGTLLGAAAGAAIAFAMTKDDGVNGPAVRDVTVRHTVEYRPAGQERSVYDSETLRHASLRPAPPRPLAIAPQRSDHEYEIESVCSSHRGAPLALPAPPSPPRSTAPTTVIAAGPQYARSSHMSSTKASSRHSQHDTRRSTAASSSRTQHSASHLPREIPLPPSTRTSTYTAHEMPLPPFAPSSIYTARDVPLPPSTRASSIAAHDPPLPPSPRTSFVSRAPSPPRSARSASTVRPLTTANVRRVKGPSSERGAAAAADTVVPADSISQASGRARHRRKHRRGGETSERGSESGSKSGARSEVRVLGFGG